MQPVIYLGSDEVDAEQFSSEDDQEPEHNSKTTYACNHMREGAGILG